MGEEALVYEAVRADGRTTPARFALTAARYGYDGVIVFGASIEAERARIAGSYGIDVGHGAWIRAAERDEAARRIAAARGEADVVLAASGAASLDRFLAERESLDVLIPSGIPRHTTLTAAAQHGVRIGLDMGDLLRGDDRAGGMNAARRIARLLIELDVPFVVTAAPTSHLELRAGRELTALGATIDLPADVVRAGLAEWGNILQRTRTVRDDTFIQPGVRVLDDETDDR